MSRSPEIVIKLTPPPADTVPCPICGGMGDFGDGSLSINAEEIRYRPGTKCTTCGGSGRVKFVRSCDK